MFVEIVLNLVLISYCVSSLSGIVCVCLGRNNRFEQLFDFHEMDMKTIFLRQHHFNLSQLDVAAPLQSFIASLLVNRMGGGLSIVDLVNIIKPRLSSIEACIHIDYVVFTTIGADWKALKSERFDYDFAKRSLSFFDSKAVPSVSVPLPKGVSNVHFVSDLESVSPMHLSDFPEDALFRGVLPPCYR